MIISGIWYTKLIHKIGWELDTGEMQVPSDHDQSVHSKTESTTHPRSVGSQKKEKGQNSPPVVCNLSRVIGCMIAMAGLGVKERHYLMLV